MKSQLRLDNTRPEHLVNPIGYRPVGTVPLYLGRTVVVVYTDVLVAVGESLATFLPDTCRKGFGTP